MIDVNPVLVANRDAVAELVAASERCAGVWNAPRAPGKWSPSQIVEHVARALDESAKLVAGSPTNFPNLPLLIRPLVRAFVFNRVLRKQTFPKSRTNKAMNPISGPATPAEGRARLEAALARFDRECHACASAGRRVASSTFGTVSLPDYARFMALHTRHHCRQMPPAS
jgi:DinB family protein